MRGSRVILMVMLLWLCTNVFAADTMPSITKQYKKVPLSEVLKGLEKKTKYTIIYNPDEVDGQKLVTSNFKDTRLSSAVKRLVGKNYEVKVSGKIITVSLIPSAAPAAEPSSAAAPQAKLFEPSAQPRQSTAQAVPQEPESVVVGVVGADTIYRSYTAQEVIRFDTIMEVTSHKAQRPAQTQPTPLYAHISHHIIGGLGAGYGEVDKHGLVAASGDFSYAFFFADNWGVSAGIGADYYHTSHAYDDAYDRKEYEDTDGEPQAVMHIENKGMRHDLRQVNVAIPVMLQMEYPMGMYRLGNKLIYPNVYAAVGVRIGMPLFHRDNLKGEQIASGYYEKWDLHLEGLHEYGSSPIEEQHEYDVLSYSIAPQAEVGFSFPISEKTDIGIGAYANVSVKNTLDYLPWQVGAKVSLRWHQAAKTKPRPTVFEDYIVWDTTYTIKEIKEKVKTIHYDTVAAAQQIADVMEKSIIWFDLNDITPKLEPADMLDQLAVILVKNPQQRILVNGHTCDLGKKAYNEKLSIQRAQAVANLLIRKGVNPSQLKVQGFANSEPYYSAVHDRVLDRRVEIIPIVK